MIGCGLYNKFASGNLGARVTEVILTTQEVVFEVEMPDCMMHRSYRLPLYPEGL